MNSQQKMKERQREARRKALRKTAQQIAERAAAKEIATQMGGEAAGDYVGAAGNAYTWGKNNWEDWGDDMVHKRDSKKTHGDMYLNMAHGVGINMLSKMFAGKTVGGMIFGGEPRTAIEGDTLKALQSRDVVIAGLGKDENGNYIEPKDENRSRGTQLEVNQREGIDHDFVGEYTAEDGSKKWVNNKFLASGDEKELRPEDIWGYSQMYAYDPTWVSGHSENYRRGYSQDLLDAGAIDEHHGTMDIDMDKFEAYMKEKYKDAPPEYWEDMDESKLPTYYQDQIKKQEEEQKRKEEEERERKEREDRAASGQ
jgi:hypothetical protein